jgi:CRP/FNR family transcriptional regulator
MESGCKTDHVPSCIEIVPIFATLSLEEMDEVGDIASHQKFEKNEMVYFAGQTNHALYVVHKGKIKISRYSEDGKEQVIRIAGPGEFLGELTLFSRLPLTDFAETIEPSSVCTIEGEKMKELMKKYPSIAFKVMEELSKRLEKAESLIEEINLHSVEWRLAQVLLKMANTNGEIVLPTTKGVFASQIGMSQESLSRKLTYFQDQGYIRLSGQRNILILNKQGLERFL